MSPTDVPSGFPVLVRVSWGPDKSPRVLLQLPDGYVLVSPLTARRLADALVEVAGEVEDLRMSGRD